jgi:tetratricopeptide (TPR) repeat protein
MYPEAVLMLDEIIKMDPNNTAALTQRSQCWASMFNYKRALKDANALIKLHPKDASLTFL